MFTHFKKCPKFLKTVRELQRSLLIQKMFANSENIHAFQKMFVNSKKNPPISKTDVRLF